MKEKNKNNLVIPLIIIVSIIIFLFIAISQKLWNKEIITDNNVKVDNNVEITKTSEEKDNKDTINLEEKIIETINNAWISWDSSLCEKLELETDKNKCFDNSYAATAWKQNDIEFCKKISDKNWSNRCLDNLYNKEAIEKNDIEICSKLTNQETQNECKTILTISKIENSDKILDNNICEWILWEAKNYCEEKKDQVNNKIYLFEADKKQDTKICLKIEDETLKNKCSDEINLKLSIKENDKNKCNLIKDNKIKTQCLNNFEKKSENETYKTSVNNNNVNLCGNIEDSQKKSDCKDNIYMKDAISKKDKKLCDLIKSKWTKDTCIYFFTLNIN